MIIYKDESGEMHNDNGPAIITKDLVSIGYFNHGKLHNENGPAWINRTLDKYYHLWWYINGKEISHKYVKIYYICG